MPAEGRIPHQAMPVVPPAALWSEVARRAPSRPAVPRPSQRLRDEALHLVHDAALLQPAASWRLTPLDAPATEGQDLAVGGGVLQAPRLLPGRGRLCAVAAAVLTLGERIDERVRALFGVRRAALAVALDQVANELLHALARRVQDHMAAALRRAGLSIAGDLRAGDPGLALEAQPLVLQLAGASRIGVTLSATLMMRPLKSVALVQGVGHGLPEADWSRCDDCRSAGRCAVRHGAR